MADKQFSMIGREAAADDSDVQARLGHADQTHSDLTPEQIARWAELVADGTEAFPSGFPPANEERMLQHVRRLRRARLMSYIARQIASDCAAEAGTQHGGHNVKA